jgi:Protein of unknown function (DUF3168)
MTVSTSFPIQRAIVQALRQNSGPESYVFPAGDYAKPSRTGQQLSGKWLHEGFAPEKTAYPFVTYQQWPTVPAVYTWGSVMVLARFDVKVFSKNSVEANNLFALVAATLDEAELPVAGQSTLICRRVADLRSPDVDEEGQKIYMVGGTYEVWTDQPLPQTIRSGFTLDAVIV